VPLLPADPFSLIGLALVAVTVAMLVASDWPKAYLLGASTIVLFALQFFDQAILGNPLGLRELALTPSGFLAGEWWTPISYAFLHGGLMHIIGNLFILLTAGPALEDSVGPTWFLGIYAAGALVAAGAGVGLAYVDVGQTAVTLPSTLTPMVGSSGAIFAVLTAFAVRHPREKLPLPFYIILWLPAMVVLLAFLAMNIGYMFLDTSVAWYGHFGGFLAGLAIASLPIDFETEATDSVDLEGLAPLAEDPKAQQALERLREVDEDQADVAEVWLDEFAENTQCPVCSKPLQRDGLDVRCPSSHDVRRPSGADGS
jgi:membrane associated rhomboid family serine protease